MSIIIDRKYSRKDNKKISKAADAIETLSSALAPGKKLTGAKVSIIKKRKKSKLLNLMSLRQSILPSRKPLTFTYKTYYNMSLPALQDSATKFISLVSVFDPEYDNLGRNDTMGYYNKYMGATAGLYTKYKPYVAEFNIKAIPTTAGTMPIVVFSGTDVGTSDYGTTVSCYKIAERPGALSKQLEYLGDTSYTSVKFKMYMNQVFGVTREQYKNDSAYSKVYNTAATDGPWLAISLGDATGAGGAQTIALQITMKLKCIIFDPVPVQP